VQAFGKYCLATKKKSPFIVFSSWHVATIILKLNSMFVLQERPPLESLSSASTFHLVKKQTNKQTSKQTKKTKQDKKKQY